MLRLFKHTVNTNATHKQGFLFIVVGEQFSEYDHVRIGDSGLLDHVPGDIELRAVTVVQSEALKLCGHLLDISFHILPGVWRVAGLVTIPDPKQITPDINPPP